MKTISEILKLNWFYKKWNIYDRDDWIQINYLKYSIRILDWDNKLILYNFKNQFELIWYLVLRNIINRLY